MHADDTNYTVVKNGIVVVSGTGPAIRVDGNRLVIRDGPEETPPLRLTRAEASRRLRHIIVCGHAGGFVTFDALRWLRDTGVAFSQLDWDGAVVIASGPPGPDQPDLRRAQALVCSGVIPKAADAIACEILRVKLCGQAEVAGLLGFPDANAAIGSLAGRMAGEIDGKRALSLEAEAAWIYWNLWERMPVRFARRNPQRLGPNGRWRPGRPDPWLTFGSRTSLLSGKPSRATTPGNCLLNYLYAILEAEMTVALLAPGLDPGIGMFHADIDGRLSLALDAIEAVRPYVEYWLFTYLQATVFANRDFHELPDGEVRLSHPLNSHLAHTAALWRKGCEPVVEWLSRCFDRVSRLGQARAALAPVAVSPPRAELHPQPLIPALPPPPPGFMAATGERRLSAVSVLRQRAGVREEPVLAMCWECGRALAPHRRAFCGDDCAQEYRRAMGKRRPAVEAAAPAAKERHCKAARDGQQAAKALLKADRKALRRWYTEELQPRLSRMDPTEIIRGAAVRRSYAYYIVAGTRVPHPRHYPSLAALVGVEVPRAVAAALSMSAMSEKSDRSANGVHAA
jgi:CRISPR/Cas system-associated endonuclease Cas1